MWRHASKAALYSLAFLVFTASVYASEYYVRNSEPVFPSPPLDLATVYIARMGETASWKEADALFVDDQPLGLLPGNAFLVATVKSGLRLMWWSAFMSFNSERFDFKPGRTYLLRSTSRHGYWYLDDPGRIAEIVRAARLSHAKTTASGLALLREQTAKKYSQLRARELRKYQRAQAKSGPAADVTLPLAVKGVDYQQQLGRFKEPRFWGRFGGLHVDDERLRWRSSGEDVEIAIEDIREISFAGLSIREHVAWLRVRYGPQDALREAFFHSPVDDGPVWSHNRKFATLANAMDASTAR